MNELYLAVVKELNKENDRQNGRWFRNQRINALPDSFDELSLFALLSIVRLFNHYNSFVEYEQWGEYRECFLDVFFDTVVEDGMRKRLLKLVALFVLGEN